MLHIQLWCTQRNQRPRRSQYFYFDQYLILTLHTHVETIPSQSMIPTRHFMVNVFYTPHICVETHRHSHTLDNRTLRQNCFFSNLLSTISVIPVPAKNWGAPQPSVEICPPRSSVKTLVFSIMQWLVHGWTKFRCRYAHARPAYIIWYSAFKRWAFIYVKGAATLRMRQQYYRNIATLRVLLDDILLVVLFNVYRTAFSSLLIVWMHSFQFAMLPQVTRYPLANRRWNL